MRRIVLILVGTAALMLAGCGKSPAQPAGGASASAGSSGGAAGAVSPGARPDAGPAHDDHTKLCAPLDPAFLKRAGDPRYDWAAAKLVPPRSDAGWSCVSSNAEAPGRSANTLVATVLLDACTTWNQSLAAMKQAPNFHPLGIGDEGGYVEPRVVGMRIGKECFSILTSITNGTTQDAATAGKVTQAIAAKLAEQIAAK